MCNCIQCAGDMEAAHAAMIEYNKSVKHVTGCPAGDRPEVRCICDELETDHGFRDADDRWNRDPHRHE